MPTQPDWRTWPLAAKLKYLAGLRYQRWCRTANTGQTLPEGSWRVWYARGGRGSGKTRTGAETLAYWILSNPPGEWGVIAPTYGDARDTCIEGSPASPALLDALGPAVENWNRSMGELRVANGSVVRADGADDGALRVQGRNLRGCWCIEGSQRVLLRRGETPIRDVRVGDEAWTRDGWRAVTAHALMRREAPLLRIEARDGQAVLATDDHPVWTEHRGWVPARSLRVGDTLRVWSSPPVPPLGTNGMELGGTGPARATTRTTMACSSIPSSGRGHTAAAFLMAGLSTIATKTRPITSPRTWRQCLAPSIWSVMVFSASLILLRSRRPSAALRKQPGPNANRESTLAPNAAKRSTRLASAPASAPPLVGRNSTVRNIASAGSGDVFDITVEGAHEFVAGGILVKNCDEVGLWKQWQTAWEESISFAVRLDPALIIATGTPKGKQGVVKLLLDDPADVVMTRLLLEENEPNLSPVQLAALRRRYEGSRLGRQELHGEILDDVEGALWTWAMIDSNRAELPTEGTSRTVVAVDPAATSKDTSDETGIVAASCYGAATPWPKAHLVGGEAVDHYWVRADRSGRYSPRGWAQEAVELYHELGADCIVAERNQGGEMVEATIRSVDPNVPIRLVWASKGKMPRAEPISALYEQSRCHHPEPLPELESEMTAWVPGEPSPSRMDALVWALTDLSDNAQDFAFAAGNGAPVESPITAGIMDRRW